MKDKCSCVMIKDCMELSTLFLQERVYVCVQDDETLS